MSESIKVWLDEIWDHGSVRCPRHLAGWVDDGRTLRSIKGKRLTLNNPAVKQQKKRIEESYASKQTHQKSQHR